MEPPIHSVRFYYPED